jgi:hypothetical protein
VLGYYRAAGRVPSLNENTGWSDGAYKHARYMVKNQTAAAAETPGNPWYTSEGAAAAPNSLLQAQGDINLTDRQALDQWMQWPFQRSILDPAEQRGLAATAETRALRWLPRSCAPRAGRDPRGVSSNDGPTTTPRVHHRYDGLEQPDPLTSCSGFGLVSGSGLPIILQMGPGDQTPVVTAHSFQRGATVLEHCVFDETNYANSNPALQSLGRASLAARDAIVLIPKLALVAGNSYTASITVNGDHHLDLQRGGRALRRRAAWTLARALYNHRWHSGLEWLTEDGRHEHEFGWEY